MTLHGDYLDLTTAWMLAIDGTEAAQVAHNEAKRAAAMGNAEEAFYWRRLGLHMTEVLHADSPGRAANDNAGSTPLWLA